jgi:outer membrane immunogenic protein
LLLYGTGGAAWGDIQTSLTQSCLVQGCGISSTALSLLSSTTNNIKTGWVAGAGVEAMIAPNWMLRGEWLHIDLGTITDALSTVGNNGGVQSTAWPRSEKFDEFRVGLNYKF